MQQRMIITVLQALHDILQSCISSAELIIIITCYGESIHVVDEVHIDKDRDSDPLFGRDPGPRSRHSAELHLEPARLLVHLPHEGGRAAVGWQPHHTLGGPVRQLLGWHLDCPIHFKLTWKQISVSLPVV